jgi:hypothetical protein
MTEIMHENKIGYTLSGSSFRTCIAGSLNGIAQTCTPNDCNAVTMVPTNGSLSTCGSTITHGNTCSITCNNGYTLMGATTRTCNAGTLSGVQYCSGNKLSLCIIFGKALLICL